MKPATAEQAAPTRNATDVRHAELDARNVRRLRSDGAEQHADQHGRHDRQHPDRAVLPIQERHRALVDAAATSCISGVPFGRPNDITRQAARPRSPRSTPADWHEPENSDHQSSFVGAFRMTPRRARRRTAGTITDAPRQKPRDRHLGRPCSASIDARGGGEPCSERRSAPSNGLSDRTTQRPRATEDRRGEGSRAGARQGREADASGSCKRR